MEVDVDTYNASDIKYAAMSLLGRTDKPNFVSSTEPDVQKINFYTLRLCIIRFRDTVGGLLVNIFN